MKSIKCLGCGTLFEDEAVVGYLSHECKKSPEIEFEEELARLDNELADLGFDFGSIEHEDEEDWIAVELPPSFTSRSRMVVEIPLVAVVGLSLLAFYAYDRLAEKVRRAIGVR